MIKYTQEHLNFLTNNIKNRSYAELLTLFNMKFNTNLNIDALRSTCKRYGLFNGLNGRFQKGHISVYKGFGHPPTYFKKGHTPASHRPVGSERVVDGYMEIKTGEPNHWKQKHVTIWESVYGLRPKGHAVIFADGNKQNINIDNLILVSRAELLYLNRHNLIYNDIELTKVAINIAKVSVKIYQKKGKK